MPSLPEDAALQNLLGGVALALTVARLDRIEQALGRSLRRTAPARDLGHASVASACIYAERFTVVLPLFLVAQYCTVP
ncbi:hypothetical protein BV20DRAFT_453692 [Pilatotrama ljubarskyi]|nr:hypothetical protein BV20DRAFT_453692 [Pilatotrama ljubarskyi]